MVIIVPDSAWAAEIEQLLGEQLRGRVCTYVVEDSTPAQALASAKRKLGPAMPLAYLAEHELHALAAITAGADEAMPVRRGDSQQVLTLIERTTVRAAKRVAVEQAHVTAVQSEKLAALETVVAGVAHEINNPLAAVCLSSEFLKGALGPVMESTMRLVQLAAEKRDLSAAEVQTLANLTGKSARLAESKRVLDDLLDMVDTIAAIVRDLRSYARADGDEAPQLVDVPNLIDQVLRIVGSDLTEIAHVERDYSEDLPMVVVPRSRIVQVLTNILLNACHAMQDVARPTHRLRITVRADEEMVAISISDTGTGIPAEAVERIFDPFYTTKREGRGTGLGLSISRTILLRLGGDLVVESMHGSGATFIAFIPLPQREALRAAMALSPSQPPETRQRRTSVLVVEDDDRLLRIYPRVLRERFDVLIASDGQEAIEMLKSGVTADVVMSDLSMPEVDGEQLFRWLERERPELARRTFFVSGASDRHKQKFLASVPNLALEKPVSGAVLYAAIDRVLQLAGRECED